MRLADYLNRHKISNEFRPDRIIDFGVSCLLVPKKQNKNKKQTKKQTKKKKQKKKKQKKKKQEKKKKNKQNKTTKKKNIFYLVRCIACLV